MLTYLTHLPFVYLPVAYQLSVSIPILHQSCAPPSPRSAVPFGKRKGHYHSEKPLETFPFPACLPGHSAHLIPLCCYSINLLFVLHLPLCPVSICWQKTRPEPMTRDGVPKPAAADILEELVSALRTTLSPITHPQSASAHPCKLFGWSGWI